MKRKPFTVYCKALPDGKQWGFYCEHCDIIHVFYGRRGYRASHCIEPPSPYYDSGYIIELAKEAA